MLRASWHGVDDHLVTVLEDEDDGLEQARSGVEAEPQLAMRSVLLVERFDPERPVGCLGRALWEDPVLECPVVDVHAAKSASALRIASDRFGSRDVLTLGDGVERSGLLGGKSHRNDLHRLGATTGPAPPAALADREGRAVAGGVGLGSTAPAGAHPLASARCCTTTQRVSTVSPEHHRAPGGRLSSRRRLPPMGRGRRHQEVEWQHPVGEHAQHVFIEPEAQDRPLSSIGSFPRLHPSFDLRDGHRRDELVADRNRRHPRLDGPVASSDPQGGHHIGVQEVVHSFAERAVRPRRSGSNSMSTPSSVLLSVTLVDDV